MYENDPLVFHGHCLARWGAEMLNAMDASMGKASKATAPLLAIHGSEDRVVGIDGTRSVLATWGGPTSVEIVEGAYHETFNELERRTRECRLARRRRGVRLLSALLHALLRLSGRVGGASMLASVLLAASSRTLLGSRYLRPQRVRARKRVSARRYYYNAFCSFLRCAFTARPLREPALRC